MEHNAPGKTLLKVTGILYIIVAVLSIAVSLMAMLGGGLINAAAGESGMNAGFLVGGLAIAVAVVGLAQGIFGLVMGIMGVKHCNNPAKAGGCFVMGILVLVLGAIGLLGNVFGGAETQTILSSLLGLLIPALYTLGAYKNKQAA